MTDYSQGKIYMLTSEQTPEIYIGSTKETLEERMKCHKYDYNRWLKGKFSYVTSFEIIQYDDCKIHLIEDYPCETRKELELKEGEYQKMMDCVNKCIVGRTPKQWREDNKEHLQEYERNRSNKKERLEQHKEYMKEYNSKPEVKERKKEYNKEYNSKPETKKRQKEYREQHREELRDKKKEYYQNVLKPKREKKIKCICGKEIRIDNKRRHEKTVFHIKYIEEMKEKADSTNLNEFFEQFKFKLTTN